MRLYKYKSKSGYYLLAENHGSNATIQTRRATDLLFNALDYEPGIKSTKQGPRLPGSLTNALWKHDLLYTGDNVNEATHEDSNSHTGSVPLTQADEQSLLAFFDEYTGPQLAQIEEVIATLGLDKTDCINGTNSSEINTENLGDWPGGLSDFVQWVDAHVENTHSAELAGDSAIIKVLIPFAKQGRVETVNISDESIIIQLEPFNLDGSTNCESVEVWTEPAQVKPILDIFSESTHEEQITWYIECTVQSGRDDLFSIGQTHDVTTAVTTEGEHVVEIDSTVENTESTIDRQLLIEQHQIELVRAVVDFWEDGPASNQITSIYPDEGLDRTVAFNP